MARFRLRRISLTTSAEAEDAVSELLQRHGHIQPVSYTDLRTQRVSVSVYTRCSPAALQRLRRGLREGLRRLSEFGLNVGPARLRVAVVRPENWAESWKRHFKPLRFGKRLLVLPPWKRRAHHRAEQVVLLNPGLSFGTGHHPTTAFCLEQLVALREATRGQSFLDVGTGSGILAIAAAKLDYAPVRAFDIDPLAIRVAAANARQNRVRASIRLSRNDLSALNLSLPWTVVCANLITPLLLDERRRLRALVAPGGWLVLAGILKTEFASVKHAFVEAGLTYVRSRTVKEWQSGLFRNSR